jgi:gliding-associated putative ABC transporter substrate-binding component GldG
VVKTNKNKITDISILLISLITVILLNILAQYKFERFDLTSEKRYSLSDASKNIVANLEDIVYIRVYLEGELPADFKRLRDATKETLDELRAYSNGNLEYEFINPSENPDVKTRNEIYQSLVDKGLQYTNIEIREADKISEQIIFPGAIISYRDREIPVQLLKSQMGAPTPVMVNNSIQQLEYNLVSSISKVIKVIKPKIAFIQGHGELPKENVADFFNTLKEFYTVEFVKINEQLKALNGFNAIIVAKPDSVFSEKDKFIIDQFLMKGGKAIWLIDGTRVSMDSLENTPTTMAMPLKTNLEDMLFKYGCRVNNDLVMDLQALPIPVVTGYIGNVPQQKLFPWYYFPLLMTDNIQHPISKNLDAIKTEFVSSVDTVGSTEIKKTVLLTSSKYARKLLAPARVSLNILRIPPKQEQYNKSYIPVAVLLEGKFTSVFKNRIPETITQNKEIGYREESVPTAMIVIGDGDIIKNKYSPSTGKIYPLGYDKYTDRIYANKDFLLNCINYLTDDSGLIEARNKEFKLRLLNQPRVEKERIFWQIINLGVPSLLIILFGLLKTFIRKKRYSKK